MSRPAESVMGRLRAPASLWCSVIVALVLWVWVEARVYASRQDSYRALVAQVEQMSADAGRIAQLRSVPRVAVEQPRPNDELLDQIKRSMDRAELPAERWIGNDPAPPVRIPGSPYKRLSTRLTFDGVGLRPLVATLHDLVTGDPTLTIAELHLTAPPGERAAGWNADVTLSYLIYAPYQQEPRALPAK
ncbi:MAG: hypothetical protein HY763_02375 [Planctomycetes bacterium]|nr:hypothetical protein [Planctomycetota bacterium]